MRPGVSRSDLMSDTIANGLTARKCSGFFLMVRGKRAHK